jgi:hypothetical protein
MKYKVVILALLGFFSSGSFCGSNSVCTEYPGTLICENGKIEKIAGNYGSVNVENVEVSGVMKGNIGIINIEKSKINQIGGNIGGIEAANSTFIGKIEGNIGLIQFKSSSINEVDTHSPSIHLYNSQAEKIIASSTEKKIKVHLRNKSVVKGDIYFPENSGDVCIDKSSELKGKVINGKIFRGIC